MDKHALSYPVWEWKCPYCCITNHFNKIPDFHGSMVFCDRCHNNVVIAPISDTIERDRTSGDCIPTPRSQIAVLDDPQPAQARTASNTSQLETVERDLCEGMPHGSCKGKTMCEIRNPCFVPAQRRQA